ncbi:hypothetical protein AB205_0114030 [Aquarana catesbeiana]|uniref:Uncharacterized protein n=1 Tax=Aquarana catesbeiana TaxID=8400 RepID=A0A2G9QA95_AQUCT|nr:hypothetical protein AB205_0150310 [Aquarana catesbeiana]PIO13019.1 hypothetical protein AB205_0114030 [Aquarana catesbeiana]
MTGSMDLTPTPMSERPRSWRKWSRVCTEFRGTTIERSAQEMVVGPEIKRTQAVQKDTENAAKK